MCHSRGLSQLTDRYLNECSSYSLQISRKKAYPNCKKTTKVIKELKEETRYMEKKYLYDCFMVSSLPTYLFGFYSSYLLKILDNFCKYHQLLVVV